MKKSILPFIFILVGFQFSYGQNLSYTCPRTINISCGAACITLNAKFPDLRDLADDYSISNTTTTAACYPLVNPGVPGQPTNLVIDDRYSFVINLPFPFTFYGTSYNSLVASANGYISFDVSLANQFSHFSTAAGNLPTTGYDRALIMGPYHDLQPEYNTSPNQRINYVVIGTAPTRKWVLSFYKVPLYSIACQNLIENTHQIILHESTGVVEVTVLDKQICTGWNSGKAMIGMQDFTRTKAVMPIGRRVSDPPWGSIGMNETWRFVPKDGAPLYRSVELLDGTGNVIATGDTTRVNATTFEWNFPNICPPANVPTTYVVKTTYQRIGNAGTFYSLDTINVLRLNSLPANTNTAPTTCGTSVGSITVTPTAGTSPYTYTLNGGAPVTVPGPHTFNNLAAGPYVVVVADVNGCDSTINTIVTTTSTITGSVNATQTTCPLSNDGTITVTPTSGTAPYTYRLDGGVPQGSNVFTNVTPGPHTVVFTDNFGCTGTVTTNVATGNTALTGNANATSTTCPTLNDGTITVTVTSGSPAYTYRLDGGVPQASNVFNNVAAGAHTILVTDMFGCTGTFNVTVAMGVSLTSAVNSTNPPCNNINNGSITINPTSGTAPYMYSLNGGTPQPGNTFTGLAPGVYTISFTDVNGCAGSNTSTLTTNSAVTTTAVVNNPLCNGYNDGSIVLTPAGGVAPYDYSIDGGTTYQASSTFNGLTVGTYSVLIRDAVGCVYGFTYTLTDPSTLTSSALGNFATCANTDGQIQVTAGGGTPNYVYSIDNGVTYQASNSFPNLPVGNYNNIKVKDANGCISNSTATVVLNDTMRLELGADSTICFGSSITLVPQTNALTNSFKWTPAATLNNDTLQTPSATPTDTTKYYLVAKWGICSRLDSITVNILHKPVPYAGKDTTICYKTDAFLQGTATNLSGAVNFAWTPADSLTTPNASNTIARVDTTRMFTLTVTDNYGCNFTVRDSVLVTMQPKLEVFAGNDTTAVVNRPHQLMATGGSNYVWTPAAPLNNPFVANPVAMLTKDTYFSVFVTDAVGCTATDLVLIKVYEGPTYYLPNTFTPNGDGVNDYFVPVPVGIRSTDYFRVFNRYGQMMFETKEWMKGWNGMQKGKPAQAGAYTWMIKGIDKNGALVEMKGVVILVR